MQPPRGSKGQLRGGNGSIRSLTSRVIIHEYSIEIILAMVLQPLAVMDPAYSKFPAALSYAE